MKRKKEVGLLKKRQQKIIRYLKKFSSTKEQADLHNLRVEIKKLKSLILLFSAKPSNANLLKEFKPVKKVFKRAGIMRDAFVYMKLTKEYHISHPNLEDEEKMLEKESEKFSEDERENLKRIKRALRKIKHKVHPVPNWQIRACNAFQLYSVELVLARQDFSDAMHDCRKDIKSLLYNKKITSVASGGHLKLNGPYLNHLQKIIGEWHDAILVKNLFSEISSQGALNELDRKIQNIQSLITLASQDFRQKSLIAY